MHPFKTESIASTDHSLRHTEQCIKETTYNLKRCYYCIFHKVEINPLLMSTIIL